MAWPREEMQNEKLKMQNDEWSVAPSCLWPLTFPFFILHFSFFPPHFHLSLPIIACIVID
jgi:hypothetical protein